MGLVHTTRTAQTNLGKKWAVSVVPRRSRQKTSKTTTSRTPSKIAIDRGQKPFHVPNGTPRSLLGRVLLRPRLPHRRQAAGGEPAPPLADRIDADAQAGGDPGIRVPAGGSQHDLRAQPVPVGRLRPPDAFLQGGALAGAQHDRHRAKQRHGSSEADHSDVIRSRARDPNRLGHPRAA